MNLFINQVPTSSLELWIFCCCCSACHSMILDQPQKGMYISYLELQTTSFKWLFHSDDSESLHEKVGGNHQTSISNGFFRVPGKWYFFLKCQRNQPTSQPTNCPAEQGWFSNLTSLPKISNIHPHHPNSQQIWLEWNLVPLNRWYISSIVIVKEAPVAIKKDEMVPDQLSEKKNPGSKLPKGWDPVSNDAQRPFSTKAYGSRPPSNGETTTTAHHWDLTREWPQMDMHDLSCYLLVTSRKLFSRNHTPQKRLLMWLGFGFNPGNSLFSLWVTTKRSLLVK